MRLPPPRATIAIVAATVIAWGVAASANLGDRLVEIAGFIPARLSIDFAIPGAVPAWATPLTAALIHAGLLHLAFNMMILAFCGRFVEASLGPGGVLALYVVGAYAAAGAQYLADPLGTVPMVGANGAASAVIGAYALLFGKKRVEGWGPRSGLALQVLWLAVGWIGLQALVGFASAGVPGVPNGASIAIFAHVGGFLAGLLLARPLLLFRYRGA